MAKQFMYATSTVDNLNAAVFTIERIVRDVLKIVAIHVS